MISVVYGGMLC